MTFSGVPDGVMSGTNVILSNVQNIQNFDNVGLQIKFVGSAVGTITITARVDDNQNFLPLTLDPPITQPSGIDGEQLISLRQLPYPEIQIKYANASGSGILNAWLFSKDLN